MMWFKGISLLLALVCIGKATVALVGAKQFYAWRRRQYASQTAPRALYVMPVVLGLLGGVSWYFTFAYPVAYAWVISSFLTAAAGLGVRNLLRWEENHLAAVLTIDRHQTRLAWADMAILMVGGLFLFLGLAVY